MTSFAGEVQSFGNSLDRLEQQDGMRAMKSGR